MRRFWVYLLHCSDDSYYTGITNNVGRRFEQHASGLHPDSYTYDRRPLTLEFATSFDRPLEAIHFEKVLKNWSRKKKEALIRGDMNALRLHSKKKFPPRFKRACGRRIRAMSALVRNSLREFLLGMTAA